MQQQTADPRYETSIVKQLAVEVWILFRIQFSIIREQWAFIFILASIFPFAILMFLHFFTVNPTEAMIVRIITGNMLFALVIMGMNVMAQEISFQKHQGHFTFYASLPIEKINFIFANLLRGMIVSFPSFVIMAFVGQWVYGITFTFSFWLIPFVALTVLSVVGLGVFLGFWSPNMQLTNLLVQGLMMIISFMTPVLVEISELPVVLQWFSYLVPTTYAAAGLRDLLAVGYTTTVGMNMLMLLGYTVLSYALILKKIHWRGEG
ncbi:ABC transporter permease [Bacillus sp. H-16]|uniref:ABC transporter permease n=1 Tax=Alteribacter salitolerans TaxID=2912333 RepID=UPI00196604C4|nr:ABC transporter permease [Alteribacter salitolerans]MBM7096167.1 ABC transporter permease [Alteribacter salitolerans]